MSRAAVVAVPTVVGELHLDADGTLHGWCWYPDQPTMRATVELLRDQQLLGVVRAIRLMTELRERVVGDGYCGFSFPQPPDTSPKGKRVVLEARERRLGMTIGRVVVGSGDPAMEERMGTSSLFLARAAAALDGVNLGPDAATILGTLGRTLLHIAASPGKARGLARPGLQACLQRMAELPAVDLGWPAAPELSVIVTASGEVAQLAARIRGAARALGERAVEFLLIDDGAVPLAALLPTRLRGLVLVRVQAWPGRGAGLNAAAAAARGDVLAVTRPGGPGLADLDCAGLATGVIGLEAGHLPPTGGVEPSRRHNLQCVVRRCDLAAMGGFDPWADEASLWADLRAKAAALGLAVTTWATPHIAFLPGASR